MNRKLQKRMMSFSVRTKLLISPKRLSKNSKAIISLNRPNKSKLSPKKTYKARQFHKNFSLLCQMPHNYHKLDLSIATSTRKTLSIPTLCSTPKHKNFGSLSSLRDFKQSSAMNLFPNKEFGNCLSKWYKHRKASFTLELQVAIRRWFTT